MKRRGAITKIPIKKIESLGQPVIFDSERALTVPGRYAHE